jgi:FkbM family methyltransferase
MISDFKDCLVNDRYRVKMPLHIADLPDWKEWERERCISMEANLDNGDVLFDIGSETGWASAIYAQFVGPENIVMFEPNHQNWQNIKGTWDAHGYPDPRACKIVLVSDENTPCLPDYSVTFMGVWPEPALTGKIWTSASHRHIHEDTARVPQITIDTFVSESGIVPTALTIDVEGAEGKVLRGAQETLWKYRPMVWVSFHPELMMKHYGMTVAEVQTQMKNNGYSARFLGFDHEIHVFYRPVQ